MNILFNIFKHYSYNRPLYRFLTKTTLSNEKKINEIINELNQNGICVLQNKIPLDVINKIKEEIIISIKKEDCLKNLKIYDFQNQGIKRYLNAENLSPTANKFFFNSFFDKIAFHYVSKKAKAYQKMYEIKGATGKFATTDIFHFDDWRKRFKVFLYLNDVDKNNCPFCYIPKSIKMDKKRLIKEIEYVALGKSGAYGYYLPHEIENLKNRKKYNEIVITGNAGTVILVDTRGLHKGTPSLNNKAREMLAIYYDLR